MTLKLVTALIFAATLAACSDDSASTEVDADSSIVADEAAPPPPASLNQAEEIMGPAAGMWDLDITTGGTSLPTTSVCYDQTLTLAEMDRQQRQAGVECSRQDYRREGNVIVGQSICTMSGTEIIVDQRITGDMRSNYTAEMTTRMDPPPAPGAEAQEMTVVARRTGDC